MSTRPFLLAQLTDPHVEVEGKHSYQDLDTGECLARAVASVCALDPQPDAVVLTGDLVEAGSDAEYARLRAILAPIRAPIYAIPGNHDERAAFKRAFADQPWLNPASEFIEYSVDLGPIRLIALDSIVPREPGGLLCDARLQWLDAALAADTHKPGLIMLHHPPFVSGIAHMDRMNLANTDAFARLIAKHTHVERIVCGHVHRSIQARVAQALATSSPSTAHQVALDLRADGPENYTLEPPGYQLHAWWPGQGFVTHSVSLANFAGPFPF